MCIRDSHGSHAGGGQVGVAAQQVLAGATGQLGGSGCGREAVSYTPLTLPPSGLVEISVVAVALKKKKNKYQKKTRTSTTSPLWLTDDRYESLSDIPRII